MPIYNNKLSDVMEYNPIYYYYHYVSYSMELFKRYVYYEKEKIY